MNCKLCSLISFQRTPSVPQRRNKRHFSIKSQVTSFYSQSLFTVDLSMAGKQRISTIDQTREAPLFLCSKSKMVTALAPTPPCNGRLLTLTTLLLIEMPYCSIYLANVSSQTWKQARKYGAEETTDPSLEEQSWEHGLSHSMLRNSAGQTVLTNVIEFQLINMASTC